MYKVREEIKMILNLIQSRLISRTLDIARLESEVRRLQLAQLKRVWRSRQLIKITEIGKIEFVYKFKKTNYKEPMIFEKPETTIEFKTTFSIQRRKGKKIGGNLDVKKRMVRKKQGRDSEESLKMIMKDTMRLTTVSLCL